MSRLRPDQLVVGRSYRVVVPATREVRDPVTFFGFELRGRRVQVSDGHDNIIAVPTPSLAFYERVVPVIPVLPALPANTSRSGSGCRGWNRPCSFRLQ